MIESELIPTGENHCIKFCLNEQDYRIQVADLFGNILYELEGKNRFKFINEYYRILLVIQEFMVADKKKQDAIQAYKTNSLPITPVESTIFNPKPNSVKYADTGIESTTEPSEQIHNPSVELISMYPPLTPNDLQQCIQAVKKKMKVKDKITIAGEDLKQFILQAFDGKKKSVNSIVNDSSTSNISLLKDSVRQMCDQLVEEGIITVSIQQRPDNKLEYKLYEINVPQKKNLIESILEPLGTEFSSEEFVKIATQHGVQEEHALDMLENGSKEILLIKPGKYKKIV